MSRDTRTKSGALFGDEAVSLWGLKSLLKRSSAKAQINLDDLAARLKEAAEKVPVAAFPQRLEAAADSVAVTARVELVPFPVVQGSQSFSALCKQFAEKLTHCRANWACDQFFLLPLCFWSAESERLRADLGRSCHASAVRRRVMRTRL